MEITLTGSLLERFIAALLIGIMVGLALLFLVLA